MTNKPSENLKEIVKNTLIETIVEANNIVIRGNDIGTDYYYACYLIVNGETQITTRYQRTFEFSFDVSQYDLFDEISIKVYFQNKLLNERTSKTIVVSEFRKLKFVLDDHINHIINGTYLELGKALVEERNLKLGVFDTYSLNLDEDFWEENPFNNRSWQWRLHWFEFIHYIIAYDYKVQDDQGLYFCKSLIESWLNKYSSSITDFEFIWHDHATALRAEMILLFYSYVYLYQKSWFLKNTVFMNRLLDFLKLSQNKLKSEDFYSKHTNHGLEQARVLLLLGIYFNDNESRTLAITRLSSELDYSFTTEGVHKENSPGYHQFVLKVFLGIISKFPSAILCGLEDKFHLVGDKALEFIAHILRPDANLPIIGDTELLPATDSYSTYFDKSNAYQWYLYSSSKGMKGIAPVETFKVYPESGYAIYRTKWEEYSKFNQIAQLTLKAGCLSRYHHQNDESNILLYAYGEDWLIDSGLYNYINNDPIRKYMRGRTAHNIPIMPNSVYSPDFEHRINNWSLLRDLDVDQESLIIRCQNSVLVGIEQKRSLKIYEEGDVFSFSVEDEIHILDENEREVSFYWHVPSDKKITIKNNQEIEIIGTLGCIMTMKMSISPSQITVHRGIENNRVISCMSNRFGKYEDSQLIKVTYPASLHTVVITSFEIKGITHES